MEFTSGKLPPRDEQLFVSIQSHQGDRSMGSRRRGKGRRKVGRKKRRMRSKIRHRKK
jgi:hypothetical protein